MSTNFEAKSCQLGINFFVQSVDKNIGSSKLANGVECILALRIVQRQNDIIEPRRFYDACDNMTHTYEIIC